MTACRTLTKYHQVTGKNVSAFYGDRDRKCRVQGSQVVIRSHLDPLTTVDIHGDIDAFTSQLRHVIFCNGGNNAGLLTEVDSPCG